MCVLRYNMWHLTIIVTVLHSALVHGNSLLQECAKYYRSKNYFDMLPNIDMPYIGQLPIPDNLHNFRNKDYAEKIQNIDPTPAINTKVLVLKTKYAYKNPVCVKYSRKQKLCKPEDGRIRENADMLITKEYFIRNDIEDRVDSVVDDVSNENDVEDDGFTLKVSFNNLEPSETDPSAESRAFGPSSSRRTPSMTPKKIHELLIEDRLDQLETILPDYRRKRTYETSTVYITKTISNKRSMATLVVKNCIPVGYDVCPKKRKSGRLSKIAKRTFDSEEGKFYFG